MRTLRMDPTTTIFSMRWIQLGRPSDRCTETYDLVQPGRSGRVSFVQYGVRVHIFGPKPISENTNDFVFYLRLFVFLSLRLVRPGYMMIDFVRYSFSGNFRWHSLHRSVDHLHCHQSVCIDCFGIYCIYYRKALSRICSSHCGSFLRLP